jgi:hypothetical protein
MSKFFRCTCFFNIVKMECIVFQKLFSSFLLGRGFLTATSLLQYAKLSPFEIGPKVSHPLEIGLTQPNLTASPTWLLGLT